MSRVSPDEPGRGIGSRKTGRAGMARDVGIKWLIPRWMLHLPPWGDKSGEEHFVVGGARQDHAGTRSGRNDRPIQERETFL